LSQPRHGNTDNIIVFNLPADLTNSNTARWRLVGTDGHVISGRVNFSVGAATGVLPSSTDNNNVAPLMYSSGDEGSVVAATSRGVLRVLNYLGVLLLIGILFSDWYTTQGLLTTPLGTRVASISAQSIAITATLQFGMFVNDARMLGTSFFRSFFDALSTTPGSMMGLKAVIGVVLAVLMAQTMNRVTAQQRLITASVAMYLITFAYVGHSRSEAAPWLGIPLNVIHTIAMSIWLGGLAVLVFIVVPRLDTENAIVAFQRFGFVAEKAVVALSITGLVQLLRMYTNPLAIFTSMHGLLLVLKLCIVAGMIYLAAKNRQSLVDSLNFEGRTARLTRRKLMQFSLIEIGLGTAILGVTAILVGLSPA
jgi:copper transport protein